VREWARQIPLNPHGSRLVIYLNASWQEHGEAVQRKKKKE